MGSSGEELNNGIGASVGGLVWARRRNESGKMPGPDELPEGWVPTPSSGTSVKLPGREDASVDFYSLEKSKRVKALHSSEYRDSIEKAELSPSPLSNKGVKYAQREDAIRHALELESACFWKNHPDFSATPDTQGGEHRYVDGSLSAFHPTEEGGDVDEDLNSTEYNSDSAQELSRSGQSFEEPDCVDSHKEEPKQCRTPNDSGEDGAEGVKHTKGLKDLGMGMASSRKRRRSQVAHVHEFLKRKNRRRTLTEVLESTKMVSIPVTFEKFSNSTGSYVPIASNSKISGLESNESKNYNSVVFNNNSDTNGVSCEKEVLLTASMNACDAYVRCKQKDNKICSTLVVPGNESFQRLFDVPLVVEGKQSAGLSLVFSNASQKAMVGAGAQSSQGSHVETISLGNKEPDESGSTGSGTANVAQLNQRVENGASEWELKGKKKSRSKKVDIDSEAETYVAGVDWDTILASPNSNLDSIHLGLSPMSDDSVGYHVKSRPIQVEKFNGWNWNLPPKEYLSSGSTAELLVPQRLLPYRRSRFTINPKYDSSDFSVGHHVAGFGLYDVTVKVQTSYRPQQVPYISLTSKLNGQAIVGHPLAIEVLEDGFCNDLISVFKCYHSSQELNFNLSEDVSALQGAAMVCEHRPSSKLHSFNAHKPGRKSLKPRRNGLMSKKIRKLSSLTGSDRFSQEEKKSAMEKLEGPSIACVPLKAVFSRINTAMNSSVRSAPHLTATGSSI